MIEHGAIATALTLTVAVLSTGCATNGQATVDQSAAPSPAGAPLTTHVVLESPLVSAAPTGESAASSAYVSAIDRALAAFEQAKGGSFGVEEFGMTMAQLSARIDQVEAAIGVCMAAAGFEYVPVDFGTVRSAMTSDKSAPGLSPEEYRSRYGFGITTQPEKPIDTVSLGEQNRRILESLTPESQVAYRHTLWGTGQPTTFAHALEAEDLSRVGGCTRAAVERSFKPDELSINYMHPGDAIILQDPKAQAAVADWSTCMAEAGFTYRHPDDITTDLQLRFDGLTRGQDPDQVSGPAQEALRRLQDEERALAVANHPCETALDAALRPIEAAYFGN